MKTQKNKLQITKFFSISMASGFFIIAAFMLPENAQAQLHEIDQSIFGMDCAPCAYAVENRMKRMDGATNVNLSLNEGNTVVEFAPDNNVTLEEIREAIQKGGFDARDATLRLTGILNREADKWILSLPSGEKFQLDQYEDMISESDLQQRSGGEITLTGHVPKGYEPHEQGWLIHIMDV
ncbi:MAG: heavy metal-associated domain-containing protein [Balneolaceae bacterium]